VVGVSGYRSKGPGFDSWLCHIFWEAVGLERGPLSLVNIIEELLEWKSSGSGFRKSRLTAAGGPLCWPRDTHYPQKLALTSPTSGDRSVGIVCLRTKATEFFFKHKHKKCQEWSECVGTSQNYPFIRSRLCAWSEVSSSRLWVSVAVR
jgi:hypothetical protein